LIRVAARSHNDQNGSQDAPTSQGGNLPPAKFFGGLFKINCIHLKSVGLGDIGFSDLIPVRGSDVDFESTGLFIGGKTCSDRLPLQIAFTVLLAF